MDRSLEILFVTVPAYDFAIGLYVTVFRDHVARFPSSGVAAAPVRPFEQFVAAQKMAVGCTDALAPSARLDPGYTNHVIGKTHKAPFRPCRITGFANNAQGKKRVVFGRESLVPIIASGCFPQSPATGGRCRRALADEAQNIPSAPFAYSRQGLIRCK